MKKFYIFILLILLAYTNSIDLIYAKSKEDNQIQHRIEYMNFPFWENFKDDVLIEHLHTVYQNNTDLKASNAKLNEAQRIVKISFANELPQLVFNGYVGQIFNSSDELFGEVKIPDYTESHFLLPLTMNYEVDIWGKNRLKTKSYKKQFEMTMQDEKSVYIALTSAFACDYFNIVKADKLIEIQKNLIKTQEEVCSNLQKRYDAGRATINDLIFAKKYLTYLEEDLQFLEEKEDVLKNHMNVLIANNSFSSPNRTDFNNLKVKTYIPEGIDVNLLENRPDWVKAKLNIEKAGYDVRIAKKELLPSFTIVGDIGFNMYNLSSAKKFLADIGVIPAIDIFAGGRKIQYIKLQKDKYDIAVQHYEKTILTSMQETNDALYMLKSNHQKSLIADKRYDLSKQEMYLVNRKEEIGTADKINILLQKEQTLIAEKEDVSLRINDIISMINLYQAVGGYNYIEQL
jgi:multidrug efflux system outer membrane protein